LKRNTVPAQSRSIAYSALFPNVASSKRKPQRVKISRHVAYLGAFLLCSSNIAEI